MHYLGTNFKTLQRNVKGNKASDDDMNALERMIEDAYEKFMLEFDILVYHEYKFIFRPMEIDTDWDYKYDPVSATGKVNFRMIYTPEYDTSEVYNPLIVFVFNLDSNRLSKEHAKKVFERMDKTLGETLMISLRRWADLMAEYYSHLSANCKKLTSKRTQIEPAKYIMSRLLSEKPGIIDLD